MIDDDELVLYRLGEHPDPARIRAALAHDPALAARERALAADLDVLGAWCPPAPDAAQQARWQSALAHAAASGALPARRRPRRPWMLALAAAVLLALSFQLGRQTAAPPAPVLAEAAPAGAVASRAAWSHLAATRAALATLPTASDRAGRVAALIAHNRLQVEAAERAGDPELARVLRAFEQVLQQLARTEPAADAGLRAQLDFEARTLQTKLRASPSKPLQRL